MSSFIRDEKGLTIDAATSVAPVAPQNTVRLKYNGVTLVMSIEGSDYFPIGGGALWNQIVSPSGNTSLNMGAYQTVFSWTGDTPSGTDLFRLSGVSDTTGTGGAVLRIDTSLKDGLQVWSPGRDYPAFAVTKDGRTFINTPALPGYALRVAGYARFDNSLILSPGASSVEGIGATATTVVEESPLLVAGRFHADLAGAGGSFGDVVGLNTRVNWTAGDVAGDVYLYKGTLFQNAAVTDEIVGVVYGFHISSTVTNPGLLTGGYVGYYAGATNFEHSFKAAMMTATGSGNVVFNYGTNLNVAATEGFVYLPVMVGQPTGVPVSFAGSRALVLEEDVPNTEYKLWGYLNGNWRDLASGGGGGGGTVTWDAILDPVGVQTISMGAYASQWQWGATPDNISVFTIENGIGLEPVGDIAPGFLVNIQTPGTGSNKSPLRVQARSWQALEVSKAGGVGIGISDSVLTPDGPGLYVRTQMVVGTPTTSQVSSIYGDMTFFTKAIVDRGSFGNVTLGDSSGINVAFSAKADSDGSSGYIYFRRAKADNSTQATDTQTGAILFESKTGGFYTETGGIRMRRTDVLFPSYPGTDVMQLKVHQGRLWVHSYGIFIGNTDLDYTEGPTENAGEIWYRGADKLMRSLELGNPGQVLKVHATEDRPEWGAGGTTNASDITTGTLALARGGTGASLADPGADRILFWDDSASAVTWLEVGSGLTLSGTTLTANVAAATKWNAILDPDGFNTISMGAFGTQIQWGATPDNISMWTFENGIGLDANGDTAPGILVEIQTPGTLSGKRPLRVQARSYQALEVGKAGGVTIGTDGTASADNPGLHVRTTLQVGTPLNSQDAYFYGNGIFAGRAYVDKGVDGYASFGETGGGLFPVNLLINATADGSGAGGGIHIRRASAGNGNQVAGTTTGAIYFEGKTSSFYTLYASIVALREVATPWGDGDTVSTLKLTTASDAGLHISNGYGVRILPVGTRDTFGEAAGDTWYRDAFGYMRILPPGTVGYVLTATTVGPSVLPQWAALTGPVTYNDGIKQLFNPNGVNAGLNVGTHTGNPSAPQNGDIYYHNTNGFQFYQGGSWLPLNASATLWNAIGNPPGATGNNQSLNMQANTTTWTWSNTTGSSTLFYITNSSGDNGTGYLTLITTPGGGNLKHPFAVLARGGDTFIINREGGIGIGTPVGSIPTSASLTARVPVTIGAAGGPQTLTVYGNIKVDKESDGRVEVSQSGLTEPVNVTLTSFTQPPYIYLRRAGASEATHPFDTLTGGFLWQFRTSGTYVTSASIIVRRNSNVEGTHTMKLVVGDGQIWISSGGVYIPRTPADVDIFDAKGDMWYRDAGPLFHMRVLPIGTTTGMVLRVSAGGVPEWALIATGANPQGADGTLQYKVSGTSFGAVTGSVVSGPNISLTGTLTITNASSLVLSGAITFPTGVRQTFAPSTTNSGLNVGSTSSDPSSASNGDIYYNLGTGYIRYRQNGAWYNLGAWDSILSPVSSSQSLSMNALTTTWTWNDNSGSGNDLFALQNTSGNTGTGYVLSIKTPGSTNARHPLAILSRGLHSFYMFRDGAIAHTLSIPTTGPGTNYYAHSISLTDNSSHEITDGRYAFRILWTRSAGATGTTGGITFDAAISIEPVFNESCGNPFRGIDIKGPAVANTEVLYQWEGIHIRGKSGAGTVTTQYGLVVEGTNVFSGFGLADPLAILHVNGTLKLDNIGGTNTTGTTYYRASTGLTVALGIGSVDQVLTVKNVSGNLIPQWAAASGGGAVWNTIASPAGSQTLTMGAHTTTWNFTDSLTSATPNAFHSSVNITPSGNSSGNHIHGLYEMFLSGGVFNFTTAATNLFVSTGISGSGTKALVQGLSVNMAATGSGTITTGLNHRSVWTQNHGTTGQVWLYDADYIQQKGIITDSPAITSLYGYRFGGGSVIDGTVGTSYAFYAGPSSATTKYAFFGDTSSGYFFHKGGIVGIGAGVTTANAQWPVTIITASGGTSATPAIMIYGTNDKERIELRSVNGAPTFMGKRAKDIDLNGILEPPAADEILFGLGGSGYDGGSGVGWLDGWYLFQTGFISICAAQTWTTSNHATYIAFDTTRPNNASRTSTFRISARGDIVCRMEAGALAQNANAGFLWLPAIADNPSVTNIAPADTYSGSIACAVDVTNSRLYARIGSAWINLTGSGGGVTLVGTDNQLAYKASSTTVSTLTGSSVAGPNLTLGGNLTVSSSAASVITLDATTGSFSSKLESTSLTQSVDFYKAFNGGANLTDGHPFGIFNWWAKVGSYTNITSMYSTYASTGNTIYFWVFGGGTTTISLQATQVTLSGVLNLPLGIRQTFKPSSSASGLNVGAWAIAGNPASAVDGDIYYNSTSSKFRFRQASNWLDLGTAVWDSIAGPLSGSQSLAMAGHTTTWTWTGALGAADAFTLTTSGGYSTSGSVLAIRTAGNPFNVVVNSSHTFAMVSTGAFSHSVSTGNNGHGTFFHGHNISFTDNTSGITDVTGGRRALRILYTRSGLGTAGGTFDAVLAIETSFSESMGQALRGIDIAGPVIGPNGKVLALWEGLHIRGKTGGLGAITTQYGIVAETGLMNGFGTTGPIATLHVSGTVRFDLGGDLLGDLYYNAGTFMGRIAITGTTGMFLKSVSGAPAWAALQAADVTSGVFNTARLGTGTANSTVFLRGDGTWATAGGGGLTLNGGDGQIAYRQNSTTINTVGSSSVSGADVTWGGFQSQTITNSNTAGAFNFWNQTLTLAPLSNGTASHRLLAQAIAFTTGVNIASIWMRYSSVTHNQSGTIGEYITDDLTYINSSGTTTTVGGARFTYIVSSGTTTEAYGHKCTLNTSSGGAITAANGYNVSVSSSFGGTITAATGFQMTTTGTIGTVYGIRLPLGSLNGIGVQTPIYALDVAQITSTTSTTGILGSFEYQTSGTAANGFGLSMVYKLESGSGASRTASTYDVVWHTASDTIRTAVIIQRTSHFGGNPLIRRVIGGYKALTNATRISLFSINFAAADHKVAAGVVHLTIYAKQIIGSNQIQVFRRSVPFMALHNGATNTGQALWGRDGNGVSAFTGGSTVGTASFIYSCNNVDNTADNYALNADTYTFQLTVTNSGHFGSFSEYAVQFDIDVSGEMDVTLIP